MQSQMKEHLLEKKNPHIGKEKQKEKAPKEIKWCMLLTMFELCSSNIKDLYYCHSQIYMLFVCLLVFFLRSLAQSQSGKEVVQGCLDCLSRTFIYLFIILVKFFIYVRYVSFSLSHFVI